MYQNIEDILEFWFGYFPSEYSCDKSKQDMWFKNGSHYDQEIFVTFGGIYESATRGELDPIRRFATLPTHLVPQGKGTSTAD